MILSSCSQVFASDTDYVYYNGKKFIEFEFLNEGEFASQYNLSDVLRNAVKSATSYWSEMLGARAKNQSAWQILVFNEKNLQNASAGTASYTDKEDVGNNHVAQQIQDGKNLNYFNIKELAKIKIATDDKEEEIYQLFEDSIKNNISDTGDIGISQMRLGQNFGANRKGSIDGRWIDTDTVLPTNEQAADFIGTVRHELVHALGVLATTKLCDWDGNIIKKESEAITYGKNNLFVMKFDDTCTDTRQWNFHLQDQNGNFAKPGMFILTSEGFNILKETKPDAVESDYFIVDEGNFAYFIGENITDALAGATFNGISGIPTNAFEFNGVEYSQRFEGSHFQTAGMQSHRRYSNYTGFTEVELAALQDLEVVFTEKKW